VSFSPFLFHLSCFSAPAATEASSNTANVDKTVVIIIGVIVAVVVIVAIIVAAITVIRRSRFVQQTVELRPSSATPATQPTSASNPPLKPRFRQAAVAPLDAPTIRYVRTEDYEVPEATLHPDDETFM
jgi:beta-lactamase regulating signal transducer with metallopeptidase domain